MALFLVLFFTGVFQDAKEELLPLPAPLEAQSEILKQGTPQAKEKAIDALLASGDPRTLRVFDPLFTDASEDARSLRRKTVLGILKEFPREAPDFFLKLLDETNVTARETAAYALGFLDLHDPRVQDALGSLLQGSSGALSAAACYSVVMGARPALDFAEARATVHTEAPIPLRALERLEILRKLLGGAILSGAEVAPEVYDLAHRYGGHRLGAKLRQRFLEASEGKQALASCLARLYSANGRWLGQVSPPPVRSVTYSFTMQNLFVEGKSPKEIPIYFAPVDLELMRARRTTLDRGVALELPLDFLFNTPQACRPELLEDGVTQHRLRYRIPPNQGLTIGIGTFNVSYWRSRLEKLDHGVVTMEAPRGTPRLEELFDASGQRVATFEYFDYHELPAGVWVPLEIRVDVPRAPFRQKLVHMKYELEFQLLKDVWLFSQGTATELTEEGPEVRAIAHVSKVRIVRDPPP